MYKTIISLFLWPLWYIIFVPSLILLFIPIVFVPKKKLHLIVRPICWIWCLLAGQWLKKENNPPPPEGQPYLYLFNHVSMFDQFMIGAYVGHYITAIGAKEVFKYPIFGQLLKLYGGIPITRTHLKSALKSLSLVEDAINNGISFIIAPEGTRTLNGELSTFKKGPFHVAKNTGVTILPIALIGGFEAKRKNDWRLRPGVLITRFGEPIKVEEYGHLEVEGISELVRSRIETLIKA
tara:strand:+ start:899 stop:1606 length:708 start_codon:yes stop_codon:yes gene_type:complete